MVESASRREYGVRKRFCRREFEEGSVEERVKGRKYGGESLRKVV